MNPQILWQRLLAPLAWLGWIQKPRFIARFAETHPSTQELVESDFVIVRSGGVTKWACFRCPCGCGEKIALSLVTQRRPSWRVFTDWLKRPTVEPSVWQRAGCYSHFWIRKGAVQWCPGSGQPPKAVR
jgi:uncharacterized protein DUF6527